MLVSCKSVKSAFSRSAIFRSCSKLSASYTLTPVEMPKARLVVSIVTMITFKPASPANAEPTIIPSSIKVESNNVFMKNLRIMGPTLSCLSVSRVEFSTAAFFSLLTKFNFVISALLLISVYYYQNRFCVILAVTILFYRDTNCCIVASGEMRSGRSTV